MSDKTRIFIAGHRGMVGSALCWLLEKRDDVELFTQTREELDLTHSSEVQEYFLDNEIEQVYLAAAKVGGIQANNQFPADFIRENLEIQTSVIQAAFAAGIGRLLFLGSSCIYPREAEQPMAEEALLTGQLEPTNEAYAVAKIAGIKMCEAYRRQHGCDFRSIMPTKLYGPNDNFDPESSHVLAALLLKAHYAKLGKKKVMEVWGSGQPRREFLHVDDMASACVHLMDLPEKKYWAAASPHCSHINAGTGRDLTIAELAELALSVVGSEAKLKFDTSKPDGSPQKLLDISRITDLGWEAKIRLAEGMRSTYEWMLANWDLVEGEPRQGDG